MKRAGKNDYWVDFLFFLSLLLVAIAFVLDVVVHAIPLDGTTVRIAALALASVYTVAAFAFAVSAAMQKPERRIYEFGVTLVGCIVIVTLANGVADAVGNFIGRFIGMVL